MNEDRTKGTPGAWFAFSLLFLLYMFDYIDRMVVASLFPYIKQDWGLTDAECGMLVSAVYWSILVFTFPASLLIDRWSRKKCIALMGVLWSGATAVCAFAGTFRHLLTARAAIGIGEAGYAPGGTAMISALFPQKDRARVMGIWNASIPLGSAIGVAVGAFVAERFGWRYAFGLVALPGFVVALMFLRVKDYRTVSLAGPAQDGARMSAREMLRVFTGPKSLPLTYLGFAANTFVTTALLSWLPTYLHRTADLPMTRAGMMGGGIMALAVIGAPLGGFLADRWMRTRANARPLFCAVSSAISAAILFLAFSVFYGTASYAALVAGGIVVAAFVPAAAAVTQDVVHPGLRATSYSLCVIVMHLLGSSLGPIFVGKISDQFGIETAMSTLPAFALVASLLFFAASRFYAKDAARAA